MSNEQSQPRPCLGYTSIVRIENGIEVCMGCDKFVKDHPIPGRTMAPASPPTNKESGSAGQEENR